MGGPCNEKERAKDRSGGMSDKDLIQALRGAAVETGSLLCLGCGYEHSCGIHGCAIIRAAAERLEELTAKPTAPLTLEKLREMDLKEWLWIEVIHPSQRQRFRNITSAYYQVFNDYTDGEALCCGYPGVIHEFEYEDYGKTWLAYRRKPEEVVP